MVELRILRISRFETILFANKKEAMEYLGSIRTPPYALILNENKRIIHSLIRDRNNA